MFAYRVKFADRSGVVFLKTEEAFHARQVMLEYLRELGIPRKAMDVPTVERVPELDETKVFGTMPPESRVLYTEVNLKDTRMIPRGEQEIPPDTHIEVRQRVPGLDELDQQR